jgi:Ca2+-binding RTX toxin-like protein
MSGGVSTILGTGNDTWPAGPGINGLNDTINGNAGDDSIDGGNGDDIINGGLGNDTMFGGAGDDQIAEEIANAGSNLVYAGIGNDIVVFSSASSTVYGEDGDDEITSWNLASDALLDGGIGNDVLAAVSGGANTQLGGTGNDILFNGRGSDSLDGGADTDIVDYSFFTSTAVTSAVSVNLGNAGGQQTTGGGGNDTLINIEGVVATRFDDTLIGDTKANLFGGGNGNDNLQGGVGNDTLTGGNGTDLASYANAGGSVTVDLGTFSSSGADGIDSLTGIENVLGGNSADSILGDTLANLLDGGAGNDSLVAGLAGGVNDTLIGGSGDDTLLDDSSGLIYGGSGNDLITMQGSGGTLYGEDGDDWISSGASPFLDGGNGNDTVFSIFASATMLGGSGDDRVQSGLSNDSLDGGSENDLVDYRFAQSAVSVNLANAGGFQTTGGAGNDTLSGFEGVVGSQYNDTLIGDAGANTLDGGLGNDSLIGVGDENFFNFDYVSYANAGGAVTVDLGAGTSSGADGNDSLTGIEIVIGGNGHDSMLAGNVGFRGLFGGDGNDTLVGGEGGGLNVFSGDAGDDSLLAGNVGLRVLFGGDGNDTLVAGTSASTPDLQGGNDNDSLLGGANNDRLDGGDGNDTLTGGNGDDTLVGGAANDFASYANVSGTIEAILRDDTVGGVAEGADGSDRLFGIEGLIGGNFDDTLIGTSAANTLMGGDGADSLSGGGGRDLLDFGAGNDRFDWVQGVSGFAGNVTLIGSGGQDTLNLGDDWVRGPFTDNTWLNFQKIDGSSTVYSQGWESIVCFAEGTRIVTPSGEDAVENLRAGDMVLAMRDGQAGFEPLRWVGFMDVALPRNAAMAAKTAPILIKAGAIAPGMPARDLRVSPDHAMEVDGHLIPAKHLVNGSSIIQEVWCKRVRYFHLELEAHGLLLSEGTWSESYLDDGNRHAFNNAALTGLFLDFEAGRSKGQYDHRACLPVLRQGLKLDEIHGRLALRAEELARGSKGRRHG